MTERPPDAPETRPALTVAVFRSSAEPSPARRPDAPVSALSSNPEIEIIAVDRIATPALRARALGEARGRRAALLSDQYELGDRWLRAALAPAPEADALTGPVLPASSGWIARSIWLWEYAHQAPPIREGPLPVDEAAWIPAGNVIYLAPGAIALERMETATSEIDYHAEMARAGVRFERRAALAVRYRPPRLRAYLRERRDWSARMAAGRGRATGVARAALLPPVWLLCWALRLAPKPRWWAAAVAASPLAALFALAQALGELQGAARRSPR